MKKGMHLFLPSLFSLFLLAGCSSHEISAWNQKISDFGHGVSKTMSGNAGQQTREQKEYNITVPVDIDTVAARLRRHYGFEDVNAKISALRQSGKSSDQWVAAAIAEEGHEWEATPGSYYKMGANVGKRTPPAHIVFELEKNGPGTKMYITYSSSHSETLTEAFVQKLFKTANDVATGKIR